DTASPALTFSNVVVPDAEGPIMQTNEPRAIESHRCPNTVLVPPPGTGNRRAMPSTEMNRSDMAHSGKVTRRVSRARIKSSNMPTGPITRIAVITLVIDRLFHSFQTK